MNTYKILANAGLVFFSTLAATTFTGNATALQISAINALIIAGVAGFTEMKNECEDPKKPSKASRVKNFVAHALIV